MVSRYHGTGRENSRAEKTRRQSRAIIVDATMFIANYGYFTGPLSSVCATRWAGTLAEQMSSRMDIGA